MDMNEILTKIIGIPKAYLINCIGAQVTIEKDKTYIDIITTTDIGGYTNLDRYELIFLGDGMTAIKRI